MSALRATAKSKVQRPADPGPSSAAAPRAARADDSPAGSPVSDLTGMLERDFSALEQLPRRWPLYVSAPIWFAGSAALWWGLIKGASLLIGR